MMRYRRLRVCGGTYFFTVVTYKRTPFLTLPGHVALLRDAFRYVMNRHPFAIDAFVLLPDHLHCIWTLPEGDWDYSKRWRLIKGYFTRHCDETARGNPSESRKRKNEHNVWQRRFWDHMIRDDRDFEKHMDYIHYNAVKHGLVHYPLQWPHSSIHKFVARGVYSIDWGRE
jgi:putative transposase